MERWLGVEATPKFEDYKKQFSDIFVMERKNGILEARMHTKGGPVQWSPWLHHMLIEAFSAIGRDTQNEVLILTTTGNYWMGQKISEVARADADNFHDWDAAMLKDPELAYNGLYRPTMSVQTFVWSLDIPTIAVVPGPGAMHINFALLCDIVLCTPDFTLEDTHFPRGMIPGDSISLLIQGLAGSKRGALMMYTGQSVDAKTCLDWGVVSEIVPRDKIMPRARDLAERIMKQPRSVRRLTHTLTVRPLKRLLMDDYQVHIISELYSQALLRYGHRF
jgi:enoyl-CoA hydratase/carnithine racemase